MPVLFILIAVHLMSWVERRIIIHLSSRQPDYHLPGLHGRAMGFFVLLIKTNLIFRLFLHREVIMDSPLMVVLILSPVYLSMDNLSIDRVMMTMRIFCMVR